ncbi:hypothetical protein FCH28_09345 [Streptomyces piniterrae]|uniref:Secreted protein n=1 Tax=Streptomyces piniterrae TaxID=2571125 RepID=A0A4U0NMS8_9ACTN|nr:SCO2322 family protein [Streptomyces piniterrae]TJZ55543.1 hypothetical protein FCH28_09345 [Streptomyces piniterrae]
MRRTRGIGVLLLTGAVTGLAAAPAQAQEYRYWSFWQGGGGNGSSWAYASEGPGTLRPSDGAVEGFRFTVSADSAAAGKPRAAADFDAICRGTPAKGGTKRIGVVIDFGTAADAPRGETPPKTRTACARVPEDASAAEALAGVTRSLRYDSNSLLCGIAGYPKAGCADEVSGGGGSSSSAGASSDASSGASPGAASDAPSDGDADSGADGADGGGGGGPSAGLFGGIAAVAVLGAAAVWQAHRRRG